MPSKLLTLSRVSLAVALLPVLALAQGWPKILEGDARQPVAPSGFYFEGQSAPSLMRNAAAAQPGAGRFAARRTPRFMFDDFTYAHRRELARNGWIVRAAPGWPGIPGATWWAEGVTFVTVDAGEGAPRGSRALRMTSRTDGTAAGTRQTQVCHRRKYLEGTYAARVRFTDAPVEGPGGDQLVEAFYLISPLKAPWDMDYSEIDFEYLPNGGWGIAEPTLYATTWETFYPEPNWKKDNVFDTWLGPRAGWHTLVTQVSKGKVRYFVDGRQLAEHGDRFYPESLMSINFNLWFIRDGAVKSAEPRSYQKDVDWVFFESGGVLSPAEVESRVAALRRRAVKFRDTVPAPRPALESPCNL